MNAESIPTACDEHHLMEGFDIGPGTDGHAFFLSQPYVVARLLFHPCKDLVFGPCDINQNCARGLDIMGRGAKCQVPPSDAAQGRCIRFLVSPEVRFELEED